MGLFVRSGSMHAEFVVVLIHLTQEFAISLQSHVMFLKMSVLVSVESAQADLLSYLIQLLTFHVRQEYVTAEERSTVPYVLTPVAFVVATMQLVLDVMVFLSADDFWMPVGFVEGTARRVQVVTEFLILERLLMLVACAAGTTPLAQVAMVL